VRGLFCVQLHARFSDAKFFDRYLDGFLGVRGIDAAQLLGGGASEEEDAPAALLGGTSNNDDFFVGSIAGAARR
jgi:hypothetical protein